jgi:hypothetical protein
VVKLLVIAGAAVLCWLVLVTAALMIATVVGWVA